MTRAHAAAVKVLLDASTVMVYDGEVPADARGRYVVFYLTTALGRNPRVSADMGQQAFNLSTLYAGDSPNECRWVAEKVQSALTRKRPAVANMTCTPLKLGTAGQVRKDDSINPPAWIATDVWQFASTGNH
jgi:hypothetical protein